MTAALKTTDLGILTTEEFRAEFKALRRNALHCTSKAEWMEAVTALLPDDPTPQDWVWAAEIAITKCDRCSGTGRYSWGASVNGKMTHSGPCFRCEGKGHHNQDDYKRNWAYDRYAVVAAFRAMVG
jgi:hypothetical protein